MRDAIVAFRLPGTNSFNGSRWGFAPPLVTGRDPARRFCIGRKSMFNYDEDAYCPRMFRPVDTKDSKAVEEQACSIYSGLFPKGRPDFVREVFAWANQFFAGKYDGYLPIDVRYHDLEHTMQGTLCMVRLLQGRHRAGATPAISMRMFELGLTAILFHDTGYLKKADDTEGTGAKYTPTHVARSGVFAEDYLKAMGWPASDVTAVQNMIRCTGVNVNLKTIHFRSAEERLSGFALATADLLGQMAADNYVTRLPELYQEFAEAARVNIGNTSRSLLFTSCEDLMRQTPAFWTGYVLPKINDDFERLYTFLNDPYPDGPNDYLRRVERNIAQLQQALVAKSK